MRDDDDSTSVRERAKEVLAENSRRKAEGQERGPWDAEEAYRAAIAAGDTADGWFNLGLLLSEHEGRAPEAEEAYRAAIAAGNPKGWYLLGILLSDQEGRKRKITWSDDT